MHGIFGSAIDGDTLNKWFNLVWQLFTKVYKFEDCKPYYKLLLSLIAMIQFDMNPRSQTISISTLSENFGSTVPIDFHCPNFRPCITAYTWSKSQRYPFLRLRI
jgi:hypothetical protein